MNIIHISTIGIITMLPNPFKDPFEPQKSRYYIKYKELMKKPDFRALSVEEQRKELLGFLAEDTQNFFWPKDEAIPKEYVKPGFIPILIG